MYRAKVWCWRDSSTLSYLMTVTLVKKLFLFSDFSTIKSSKTRKLKYSNYWKIFHLLKQVFRHMNYFYVCYREIIFAVNTILLSSSSSALTLLSFVLVAGEREGKEWKEGQVTEFLMGKEAFWNWDDKFFVLHRPLLHFQWNDTVICSRISFVVNRHFSYLTVDTSHLIEQGIGFQTSS